MPPIATLLKNIGSRIAGRVGSNVLAFLFYAALARTFGESGMGSYASAFATAHLFAFGVQLGLRSLLTREVAKNREVGSRLLGNLLLAQIALATIIGALLLGLFWLTELFLGIRVLLMIAFLAVAIQSLAFTFVGCLEAIQEMAKVAALEIVERLAIIAVGASLILAGQSLAVVMTAYVLGSLAHVGLGMYWSRQAFGPMSFAIDIEPLKKILIASLPFLGAYALHVVYSRVDVLMLYSFVGQVETGAYAVAYRCIETALIVALITGLIIYPELSRAQGEKAGELAEANLLYSVTLKWLSILGVLGAVLLWVVGDGVIVLIFGSEYVYSGEIVRYMSALFLLGCIKVPFLRLLLARHRERLQLLLQAISIACNIALNIILIPRYGAFGAIAASVVSEFLLVGAFYWHCTKVQGVSHTTGLGTLVLSAGLATAAGIATRDLVIWPVTAALVVAVFAITALWAGLVSPQERAVIMQLFLRTVRR